MWGIPFPFVAAGWLRAAPMPGPVAAQADQEEVTALFKVQTASGTI